MSKRLIFTIMAAGVIVAPLSARQLDPSEALSRAEVYVPAGVRTPLSSGKNQHPMTLKYTATNRTGDLKTVYVFGRGEDNGFVVVAADDVAPSPLLGYADSRRPFCSSGTAREEIVAVALRISFAYSSTFFP